MLGEKTVPTIVDVENTKIKVQMIKLKTLWTILVMVKILVMNVKFSWRRKNWSSSTNSQE